MASAASKRSNVSSHRSRIIEAATALFELHGFRSTGVDAIAGLARVSKRTIYECFPDKHAVLEAVLTEFTDRQFREIAMAGTQVVDLQNKLVALAEGVQRAAMEGRSVAMMRLQIAESSDMPATAGRLAHRGQCNAVELLVPTLHELGVADADVAAKLIYDIFVLAPLHRRLTDIEVPQWDVRQKVKLLLRGFGIVWHDDR